MKLSPATYLLVFAALAMVALGQFYMIVMLEPSGADGGLLAASGVMWTIYCLSATFIMLRLTPRLMLRGKLGLYGLSLLGFAAGFVGVELLLEWWLQAHYRIVVPSDVWYLGNHTLLEIALEITSMLTAYVMAMAGMSMALFWQLWRQSGIRVGEAEAIKARAELEQARSQIDADSLLSTLDSAAERVVEAPEQVTGQLRELSRSLRTQLYQSAHCSAPEAVPAEAGFDLYAPTINFLVDRRWRRARRAALVVILLMVLLANLTGPISFATLVWQIFAPLVCLLVLVWLNARIFTPRLLLRGRLVAYFAALPGSIVLIVGVIIFFSSDLSKEPLWFRLLYVFVNAIKNSFLLVGVSVAMLFVRWIRGERRIAELRASTLFSELEQLQNQVNPHFLFNMLNNIIVLTRRDPAQAAMVLRKLGAMLRYQFTSCERQSVRLGEGVAFLTDYLNLEKLRRDRFEATIEVGEGIDELELPPMIFLPFVENAVKHGNDNRAPSSIGVCFKREGEWLRFECINSKPERPARREAVGGLGLPNVRRRLELLYGEQHRLEITQNETTFRVELRIRIGD